MDIVSGVNKWTFYCVPRSLGSPAVVPIDTMSPLHLGVLTRCCCSPWGLKLKNQAMQK